ncbi:MAG: MmcQ/YjbR family DNA-binding protein [Muribaculaceae bacterium]|nr:MmcQ/YjbR family DNA-binding protein [Muribaculaceae bacterium]
MNIEEIREFGLALPHVTERLPFGPDTYCLEIGGKMFCLMTLDGEWDFYNLKVDPVYSEQLREQYTGIKPGYHMNKKHWISVQFEGDVSDELQKKLICHSYYQTARNLTKKLRAQLGLDTEPVAIYE